MKGKGKSMPTGVAVSDKDCCTLLPLPDLNAIDHAVECPRYSAVIARSESDGIAIDELSVIQSELEILLAAAGKRLKLLETELSLLTNSIDKKDKKPGKPILETQTPSTPSPTLSTVTSSNKRGKIVEERQSKKFKDTNGKASTPSTPGKVSKGKNLSGIKQNKPQGGDGFQLDSSFELMKNQPKNDTVNKFWAFVEPYCTEVTSEDVKFLEEVFRSHDEDADYFKIPSLGKHYSHKWAQEDLAEERFEGSRISDKRRSLNNNTMTSNDASNLLKRAEAVNEDHSPFGPLTQRLVSALIEENIMTTLDDSMNDVNPETVEEVSSLSPRALAKQLNIGNPAQLERRIRRELEEQGILQSDDKEEDSPDDEVLQELRRKQQELRAVTQQNHAITKRLMKLAKEEMARQDLRKKLIAADAEVMDAYRRIQSSKQKKKPPTKKEKDAAWRALKDRDAIVKQIENT